MAAGNTTVCARSTTVREDPQARAGRREADYVVANAFRPLQ
jgi:hypothetical protein